MAIFNRRPPDKPLGSPLDNLSALKVAVGIVVASVPYDLCPKNHPQPDPPFEDHSPAPFPIVAAGAIGSTSSAVPFFGNNSDSTAAQVVRQSRLRQEAHTRIAQISFSTSPALLTSTGGLLRDGSEIE